MTEEDVVALMKSSKSEAEWNANCDTVLRAFDGKYPDFWFSAINLSGVAAATSSKWK